jgi:hypothetical protein
MWVKNVYNLCQVYSTNCGALYTGILRALHTTTHHRVQPQFYTLFTRSFTPLLYTVQCSQLTVLTSYFSPFSTGPIITKTN